MDRLTDSDDSAMQRRRDIGKSVRHEILLQLRKPAARRRFEQPEVRGDDG
jgi:hypothetical protein